MVWPSRMMVIESEIFSISFSLWLIMMLVMPSAWRPLSRSSRCSLSVSLRAAVGSSRISSLTSLASALAISTSCCLPTPMLRMGVSGLSSRPTMRRYFTARARFSCQSITPPLACSLPRNMFSVIVSSGIRASSWWMMTIPACSLSRMLRKRHSWPSYSISPV